MVARKRFELHSKCQAKFNGPESGQAVIEYMLVLAVTILLIITFIYQFSTAFRAYANNYFGEYVACLLETGALPGGGGDCSASWKSFNLADGKTASGGSATSGSSTSGSGSGSGNGSGSGSGNGSKSGKSGSSNKSKTGSDSASASSSSPKPGGAGEIGQTGGGSSGSGLKSNSRQRSTSISSSGKDQGGKAGREPLTALGSVSNSDSGNNGVGGRRTSLSRDYGYAGQKEDEDREASKPGVKPVAVDNSGSLKPKKVAEAPARAPASKMNDDSAGFSLGGFVRILLIAGILIVIFVVFGGQLLAISKGGEK